MPRPILILRDFFVLALTAVTTLLFLSAPIIAIMLWAAVRSLGAP